MTVRQATPDDVRIARETVGAWYVPVGAWYTPPTERDLEKLVIMMAEQIAQARSDGGTELARRIKVNAKRGLPHPILRGPDALKVLLEISATQGWNALSETTLLLRFIDSIGEVERLRTYLQQQAAEENELNGGVE